MHEKFKICYKHCHMIMKKKIIIIIKNNEKNKKKNLKKKRFNDIEELVFNF